MKRITTVCIETDENINQDQLVQYMKTLIGKDGCPIIDVEYLSYSVQGPMKEDKSYLDVIHDHV